METVASGQHSTQEVVSWVLSLHEVARVELGNHSSGTRVAARLVRPTQGLGRATLRRPSTWPCSGWGLPSAGGAPIRRWTSSHFLLEDLERAQDAGAADAIEGVAGLGSTTSSTISAQRVMLLTNCDSSRFLRERRMPADRARSQRLVENRLVFRGRMPTSCQNEAAAVFHDSEGAAFQRRPELR